jgi:hypothetical protein
VIDGDRVKAASDRWLPQTGGASADPPRAPLDTLLGEATVVGLLYQAYWEPKTQSDGSRLPGFADWSQGPLLHAHSGYELLELVTAVAKAEADYARAQETPPGSPMVRAQEVLQQLKGALEYLFDDAAYTDEDKTLENLRIAHRRPRSQKMMASALQGYWKVAVEHRAALGKLPGFDLALIPEALTLSERVVLRRWDLERTKESSGASDAMARRNQLLAVLRERVGQIRRVARLAFRAHPEVARRFSSDYQRARRRAAKEKGKAGSLPQS